MAKGKVTDKSLRVGQTVWIVDHYRGCRKTMIRNNLDKFCLILSIEYLGSSRLFYSKKKAKTKMKKLNEGRG